MITIRKAEERGRTKLDWLDSRHSFSFGRYYDPKHTGYGSLLVINDDRVAPGRGFGTHPHDNMEILSYVLEGRMRHKDSMGNGSVIQAGDLQRMSAGTGITHSEFNDSPTEPVHFYQIWIEPDRRGLKPGYEQISLDADGSAPANGKGLQQIAGPEPREGALTLHQDVVLYRGRLGSGESVRYEVPSGRRAWVQAIRGDIRVNGVELQAGDGAAIEAEGAVEFSANVDSEFLLFDLA